MPQPPLAALVFDLDGVLLRTTMAKHDAMLSVLAPIAADRDAISRAILRRGGVPRRDKLREIVTELGGNAPSSIELDTLLQRYDTLPQVTIAVLEGAVMGGGFGLACIADVAIAHHDAQFAM